MLFSHLLQVLIGRRLIILHVNIPGCRELDELLPLHVLDLEQLNLLSLLHFTQLPPHFDSCNRFELGFSCLCLEVFFFLF